jgi:hypothetical protein
MVFVRPASQGESAAACFEADDNETHPDGFVTVRTDLDHEVNDTELSDVLFVTNHHRKRYAPSGCGRYEGMRDKVEAMAAAGGPALTLADLRQMMKDVEFQGGLVETFHTILFKPSDWTLTVLRIGPDHRASDDPGVTVPPEVLFPWGR